MIYGNLFEVEISRGCSNVNPPAGIENPVTADDGGAASAISVVIQGAGTVSGTIAHLRERRHKTARQGGGRDT